MKFGRIILPFVFCSLVSGSVSAQSFQKMVCYEMLRGVPSVRVAYQLRRDVLYKDDRPISNIKGLRLGTEPPVRFARHKILPDRKLRRVVYSDSSFAKILFSEIYDFRNRKVLDEKDGYNSCFRKRG